MMKGMTDVKRLAAVMIAVLAFLAFQPNGTEAQNPDYEKYGRMAIAIVSADYPGDPIRDYQYLGRQNINESEVADTFRFRVVDKGRSLYVRVTAQHNLTTGKLVTLKVEPEKR
ncbi:DUF3889 domain-containing protein [Neobacillus notoginsengisoli]|uniref:DUF3889 domain-containing protein n=1 Tax=Neobacillus notoginsengisoli TaxID=1578198 RepID=A0A417YL71_9BACI|nr:DUF3889 domain-containing protein [Neobacillus notoginsengisoli]RHW34134.1 DUF3889 domain-containing protein [Neobacillus notoginsengisoli]